MIIDSKHKELIEKIRILNSTLINLRKEQEVTHDSDRLATIREQIGNIEQETKELEQQYYNEPFILEPLTMKASINPELDLIGYVSPSIEIMFKESDGSMVIRNNYLNITSISIELDNSNIPILIKGYYCGSESRGRVVKVCYPITIEGNIRLSVPFIKKEEKQAKPYTLMDTVEAINETTLSDMMKNVTCPRCKQTVPLKFYIDFSRCRNCGLEYDPTTRTFKEYTSKEPMQHYKPIGFIEWIRRKRRWGT